LQGKAKKYLPLADIASRFPEIAFGDFCFAVPFYLPIHKKGVDIQHPQLLNFLHSNETAEFSAKQRRFSNITVTPQITTSLLRLYRAEFNSIYTTLYITYKREIVWGGSVLAADPNSLSHYSHLTRQANEQYDKLYYQNLRKAKQYYLKLTVGELTALQQGMLVDEVIAKSRLITIK
jgi:hypothetical protein